MSRLSAHQRQQQQRQQQGHNSSSNNNNDFNQLSVLSAKTGRGKEREKLARAMSNTNFY